MNKINVKKIKSVTAWLFVHLQAWTALPVFHEGFVLNGSYQLPLYTEEPPEVRHQPKQVRT